MASRKKSSRISKPSKLRSDSEPTNAPHSPIDPMDPPTVASTQSTERPKAPIANTPADDLLAKDSRYVTVAQIGRSHGLHGMVFVQSYTDPKENLFQYTSLQLGAKQPIRFMRHQMHGKHLIAAIEGVTDCDSAKRLTNQMVYLPIKDLPVLPEGQYYWHQLAGLRVINHDGRVLGQVAYVAEGSQFPILMVKDPQHPKKADILVPYEPSVVLTVNPDAGEILVHWDID